MFTLRKITKSGVEMNIALGNEYTIITKERNPKEFKEYLNAHYYQDKTEPEDILYGIISDENGKVYELYKPQKSYIMCGNGKTFDNVSYSEKVI